jgi:hypothetical protein
VARNPLAPLRTAVLVVCLVAVLISVGDWYITMRSLSSVRLAVQLHPAAIPADGQSKSRIVVRVTDDGRPRAHDYLQAVSLDSGYLVPLLAKTDEHGEAIFSYASLPASPYDTTDKARIQFTDVSLGRIIEVDKSVTIHIRLLPAPTS